MHKFSVFFLMLVFCFFGISTNNAVAEVTVDPFGLAVQIEAEDELDTEITLHNFGDDEVEYRIRWTNVRREEDDDDRVGPRRDEPGETLEEVELEHGGNLGMGFDHENRVMWVTHLDQGGGPGFITGYEWDGAEITDIINDFEVPNFILGGTYYDGVIYCTVWQRPAVVRYTVDGENLGDINVEGQGVMACAADPETGYLYVISYMDLHIQVLDINDDFNRVGFIENLNVQDGDAADFRGRIGWAPEHEDGHLWLGHHWNVNDGCSRAFQLSIDEDWNWEEVQHFDVETDVRSPGIAHDGRNLWIGNEQEAMVRIVDDGVSEVRWLIPDPEEGSIGSDEDEAISIAITSEELEEGVYEVLLRIDLSDEQQPRIECAIVMSVDSPVAQLSGTVMDPAADEPIEGVYIEMDYFVMARFTNVDGEYSFDNLPMGEYEFTFTAPGYLSHTETVEIEDEDDIELNVELLHGEFTPSQDEFITTLEPGSEQTIEFEVENTGNAPLEYSAIRRLIGGADADPWELREVNEIEETVDDNQVSGVVVVDGNFYIAGGNNRDEINKIYVVNMEGELIRDFDQFHRSDYGMRDITWDGELIWGSDNNVLYGFDTEGELIETIEGEARSYRSLTWNPDDNLFISADISSDIFITNSDGNQVAVIDRPEGLRTYGLAYWSGDPDGYKLYVLSRGEGEGMELAIYKINLENGDMSLITEIDMEGGGRPGGCHITNQWDVYCFVLLGVVQNPDRIAIWQLAARRDWFILEPTEGDIEVNESEEFTLLLDATDLPPDNTFEGELVFTHDAMGGQTILPVSLEVVEGNVHTTRRLDLELGWNLVSVNLQPDEEDVEVLTADLVEADLLEMMKDGAGHFYRPDYNFNNIPGWFVEQGYQVKMRGSAVLELEGITVLRDDAIDLAEGWQLVSYYPRFQIETTIALSGIEDHLVIAKDGFGNFYIPAWDYSNMGRMREGQGYYVNVDAQVRLVYLTEREEALRDGIAQKSVYSEPGLLPVHPVTDSNMSLLILADPALEAEVGVYASSRLIGSGVIQNGTCGIAVWGDDPTTPQTDGALEGDELVVKLLGRTDIPVCRFDENNLHSVDYTLLTGEAIYQTDGLAVIRLNASAEFPVEYGITAIYPNPFNASTRISYGLPEAVKVDLNVYDLSGRRVMNLLNGLQQAGHHTIQFNGVDLASGVYLLRLETVGHRSEMKITLIK
ncbi:MAG: carboxypeptidase regulatory-like domain-containing protein [Candidatus Hatepunaea meridiana]|nr:carboxypeptidase regulatory-like domain-containing protein [Candidatus Hatepunaea meridiana]